jgi:hypothetical protein
LSASSALTCADNTPDGGNRERTLGAFPDGNSAINLEAARLRHIAGTRWSTKRYLNMQLLRQRNAMTA